MNHASLFTGIGGFDLAAEWMGWKNIFHCEFNPFCQNVLNKNFKSISYGDITKTDFTIHRGNIDVLSGGFPCQPFSVIGKRAGAEDERYLWPEFLRAITEIRPPWIVGENVAGIISMESPVSKIRMETEEEICYETDMVLKTIKEDLQKIGYDSKYFVIPACAIGTFHKRDRIWIIAHSNEELHDARKAELESRIIAEDGRQKPEDWSKFYTFDSRNGKIKLPEGMQCKVFRNDDGIPEELDEFGAYGNTIQPQVAYEIFKTIQAVAVSPL